MARDKLNIAIITMDEPFYLPQYVYKTLTKLGSEVNVLKVYALPPSMPNRNFFQEVQYYFSYFGAIVFTYMALLKFYYILTDCLTTIFNLKKNMHSVKSVCNNLNVKFSKVNKLNSKEVYAELKESKPDIVFSLACPQIFGKKIISIPSKGCLNIHSSLLPKYRGLNANFWVLAKGEETTGVTIHYINPGIDDGDIVLQEKIQIDKNWSLNDLYLKVIDVGSSLIAKSLKQVFENTVSVKKNDLSKGSYFSAPTGEDVKEFRSRKKKFFRFY